MRVLKILSDSAVPFAESGHDEDEYIGNKNSKIIAFPWESDFGISVFGHRAIVLYKQQIVQCSGICTESSHDNE